MDVRRSADSWITPLLLESSNENSPARCVRADAGGSARKSEQRERRSALRRLPSAGLVARRRGSPACRETSESKNGERQRTDERAGEWPLLFGRAALGDLLRRLLDFGAHRDTLEAHLHRYERGTTVWARSVEMKW